MSSIHSIDEAVERLYDLNVGVTGTSQGSRHERPHKPTLILATLDLIAEGQATAESIPWSSALRRRFADYFAIVQARDDRNSPENPYRRLVTDSIWKPIEVVDGRATALNREPLVEECDNGRIHASLADGLEGFVLTPTNRTHLRDALVSRFFPSHRNKLEPLFRDRAVAERVAETPADDSDEASSPVGRNQGFRRKVLDLYDYQCSACGLRINIPEVADGTFVDAAHLIPFSESRNDHPTNGLALCKNHHWAMDRFLIAPGPDHIWSASARLIPHRSQGEKDLAELHGRKLLPPVEPAFTPSPAALSWRHGRLLI